MSSTIDQELIARRNAALVMAVRRGDAFGAARAASRLRLLGVPHTRAQLAMARRARAAVGRSLVHARYFPTTKRDIVATPVAPRLLRRRVLGRRWLLAIPIAALLVVLIVLMSRPAGPDAGGGAAAPDRPATVVDPAKNNLRGRTSAAPTVVVVVTAPPTIAPPTTAPSPLGTPAATPGAGSSGGGQGTGSGGGGIGGGATAAPEFRIFTLDVFDADTGRPLANVCVNIGEPVCDQRYRTNDIGRWTFQIEKSATTKWDMQLTLAAYNTWKESFTVPPGDEPHKVVQMVRAFGGGD